MIPSPRVVGAVEAIDGFEEELEEHDPPIEQFSLVEMCEGWTIDASNALSGKSQDSGLAGYGAGRCRFQSSRS